MFELVAQLEFSRIEGQISYLKDDFIWFRDESGSFKFSTSDYLRFHNSFLLPDPGFRHIFFFKNRKFGLILYYN